MTSADEEQAEQTGGSLHEEIKGIMKSFTKETVLCDSQYRRDFTRFELGSGKHTYGTFHEEQVQFKIMGMIRGEEEGSIVRFIGDHAAS